MGRWRKARTEIQKFPRLDASVPVRVSTVDPETDPATGKIFFRSAEETTANLSHGGAFIRSWEPLEAGRRVIVDIDLPVGDKLQLVACVAWTQRRLHSTATPESKALDAPGFGIQFIGAAESELARLDDYLDGLSNDGSSKHPSNIRSFVAQP
jgi:Tfp pilus assembly protein PilZ